MSGNHVVIQPTTVSESAQVTDQMLAWTVADAIETLLEQVRPRLAARMMREGITPASAPVRRLVLTVEETGYRRPPVTVLSPHDVDTERWEREVKHAGGKQPLAIAWSHREEVSG